MIRYIFIFALLFSSVLTKVNGQDSLTYFYIADTSVTLNQQVCMSVKVNNFDSVEAFQMSMNFDPYLLDFDSIGNMNDDVGLNIGFFGLQEKHLGIIRMAFFDPFTSHTLPDSSILFDLCFTAYGLPDELCPVNISDFPFPLEVISNEQVVPSSRRNAVVDIQGGSELTVLTSTCKTGIEDTTGSLSVTIYGGNPPYFAIWQHTFNSDFSGGFGLDTFGETMVINDLIEGRYRISITDEDGTRIRDSLNLRKANDLVYTTHIVHPTCDNTPEGVIIIDSLQGGIVPVQFKWSDGELFSNTRTDLFVGEYNLTITDPLGCRTVDTFLLEANSIQAQVEVMDETCLNASDGRFMVTASGGQPFDSAGYEFIYNMDTSLSFVVSDSLLAVGRYPLQIEDSLGCIKFLDIAVGTGLSFGAEALIVHQVNCFGDSSGSIYLRPSTLTGNEILPYAFTWTGTDSATIDSSSILLHHLPPGTYTISVESEAIEGCTWDTSFIISQPPFMSVNTSSIVPASCDPDGDGQATLQIFGGTPDGDGNYLVLWDNGIDSITGINLTSGLHTATVLDLEGCRVVHEVDIPNSDPPALIGSSIRDIRCDSLPIGSILTIFSSPFGIDSYIWSNGETTSSIEDLAPGNYIVTVTDRNGCADTFSFDALPPIGPEISNLLVQNIRCFGDTNGRLDVFYTLGDGPLAGILWNGLPGDDSLVNLRSGGYEVIVVDQNGCSDSSATTLVNPEMLNADLTSTADTNFFNTGSLRAEITGGWTPYQFDWSPGNHPDSSTIDSLLAGEYFLKLTDAEGCMLLDTAMVDFVSGVLDYQQGTDFSLYPNPASSYLTVRWHLQNEMFEGQMIVINSTGTEQKISLDPLTSDEFIISLDAVSSGQYWLVFLQESKISGIAPFQKY